MSVCVWAAERNLAQFRRGASLLTPLSPAGFDVKCSEDDIVCVAEPARPPHHYSHVMSFSLSLFPSSSLSLSFTCEDIFNSSSGDFSLHWSWGPTTDFNLNFLSLLSFLFCLPHFVLLVLFCLLFCLLFVFSCLIFSSYLVPSRLILFCPRLICSGLILSSV